MNKLLEVCVDSYASAMAAVASGADRLELCSALCIGGLTPSPGLLGLIRRDFDIPVRCLTRPRGGDFLYTRQEILAMAADMVLLRQAGASGFVIGCLDTQGQLDTQAMMPLLEAAQGLPLTLHRCIDVSCDPLETYRRAARLGFDTVLTSGCKSRCLDGVPILQALLDLKAELDGPRILAGAGINAQAIATLRQRLPDLEAFHMSGKTEIESGMVFRREGVPMGLPGLDEWHIPQTSPEAVQAARAALDAES